jgi:lon-related putative ATP-dependent protease
MPEVAVDRLRRVVDPERLGCTASDEIRPLKTIIGQERAVRALHFGLAIQDAGFNVYVAGPSGTGRTTAVRRFLEDEARSQPVPPDLCYVYNLGDPYRPNAISLPAGRAGEFQSDVKSLVEDAERELVRVFESEEYAAKREETTRSFQRQRSELFAHLNESARAQGFGLQTSSLGLMTVPLREGKPLGEEALQALNAKEREALDQGRAKVQDEIKAVLRQVRALEKQAGKALEELDRELALVAIGPLVEDRLETYQECAEVVQYLGDVRDDMLENLDQFGPDQQSDQPAAAPAPGVKRDPFRKYQVNVLVDNSDRTGAPVVTEMNPTYPNLFGRIEKEPQFGTLITDFTMIRAGALHRANGGYLVVPAAELLRDGLAWEGLKRALRDRQVSVEEPAERLGYVATKTLRPEPTALDTKVIMIGDPNLYQMLYGNDPDFGELFKVKADFDVHMACNDANVMHYASFVCALCSSEGLLHLDRSAMARVVEYGARLAGDQEKLSTKFGAISDVIREASFYGSEENAPYVSAAHVTRAIDERFYRSGRVQDRIQEMIERGTIMIDVEGREIGQVNGLSVLSLGDVAFGQPARITASIGLGRGGLIDIEREANLGGPLHTKGVMILSGYLVDRYARDKPLSLSARLAFEQSYSGVDGDSASSTELYALLSSLSGLPIRQGIAVTGSVNQKGEVQAIGGVNEKIEGFFAVCQARGLTGEQGVLIPQSNVVNLMLKTEVVEAVQEGRFHIWSVRTVEEGIEILTDMPAGQQMDDGSFEAGTVHARADQRLRELAEAMRRFGPSYAGEKT